MVILLRQGHSLIHPKPAEAETLKIWNTLQARGTIILEEAELEQAANLLFDKYTIIKIKIIAYEKNSKLQGLFYW